MAKIKHRVDYGPKLATQECEPRMAWWNWLIPPICLSVISFLFYRPSLHYNFQFDDIANISKFYSIRHHTFSTIFLTGTRWISYWLNSINYSIAKFDPYIYRAGNLTLHVITGVLVFFLLLTALSTIKKKSFFFEHKSSIAYLSAALFLLHPVQTQTVSYVIQGQLEGLACLSMVSMSYCFLLSQIKAIRMRPFFLFLLYAIGFISSGTKEIAIIAPFLVMLLDWFFVAQGDWFDFKKRWLIHLILFIIIWGMYVYFLKPSFFKSLFGLTMQAHNNIGNVLTENPRDSIRPLHFLISQFKVVLHYLVMFIWPFNISVEYDWKLVKHFFALDCIIPFMLLALLGSFCVYLLRRDSASVVAFGLLWFACAIAPRSTIIPSSELLADYKTYSASIGIFLLLASFIIKLFEVSYAAILNSYNRNALVYYFFITIMMLPMGFLTYNRNKVWRSSEEFWTNIIQNAPGKARAYNNLGVALSEQGRMQESIPYYKKAINMDRLYPDPWNNLAVAYSLTNKLDLAIETLKQALKIHRNYPEGYNNLASFFIAKKDYALAKQMIHCALTLRPHYGKAYFNLGKLYMEQGDNEKAFEAFKSACTKADFDNNAGFSVYANMSLTLQKYEDAIIGFSKLVELEPNSVNHYINLANAYLLADNYQQAIALYKNILAKNPHDMRAVHNLGESYLKLNQPEKALECFEIVKKSSTIVPTLDLRIAVCHKHLGDTLKARSILETIVKNSTTSPQIKQGATELLAQLAD